VEQHAEQCGRESAAERVGAEEPAGDVLKNTDGAGSPETGVGDGGEAVERPCEQAAVDDRLEGAGASRRARACNVGCGHRFSPGLQISPTRGI
jgi:hypothetical protein